MGYDLFITRAPHEWESELYPITPEEWLRVVKRDSTLRLVGSDPELNRAGFRGPHFAIWSGPSEHKIPWLDWMCGTVYSKNPDDALINKMVEIARRLEARVVGESDEVYLGGGRVEHPAPE
jgi:hypothetical protein